MKAVLMLIDIQNDYFEKGTMTLVGSETASLNAKKILDDFRSENKNIIHIQHIALRSGSTFFLPDTIGAEIHENVKPLDNEKIIIKNYPNSFRETKLLKYLNYKKVTDIIICGMMTHLCIDATTRAAKDYGFNCTMISDACATKDLRINGEIIKAEYVHKSFLAALNGYYSSVKTTLQFLAEK
jgi:nicotinamidase-related amidase